MSMKFDGDNQGTPKTLNEAILRGVLCGYKLKPGHSFVVEKVTLDSGCLDHLERTVRDYLAQCFTPELMDDPNIVKLWERIIKK